MIDSWEIASKSPKNALPLLLNAREEGILGGYFCLGFHNDGKFTNVNGQEVDCTHWMLLPKPPVFRKKMKHHGL